MPEEIVNNLFQSTNPENFVPSGKEKEIYTGKGGRFVPKGTKGAKVKTVDTVSPDIQKKRAAGKSEKERGERLRKMIAENKAKAEEKKRQEEEAKKASQAAKTVNTQEAFPLSAEITETSAAGAEANLIAVEEETPEILQPADFTLPEVMYFNVGTAENPIIQAFTQGPTQPESAMEITEINSPSKSLPESRPSRNRSEPTLTTSQIEVAENSGSKEKTQTQKQVSSSVAGNVGNSMCSPKTSKHAQQLMLEEKARKALAERDRIVRQRKKVTPVKFKRSTRLLANQLESAKKVLASEDEYETISESGESPRKSRNADTSFGGAKPKANFKYIQNQRQIVSDVLNKTVASTKQMPQIPLVIKPNVQVPIPPQSPMTSGTKQIDKTTETCNEHQFEFG